MCRDALMRVPEKLMFQGKPLVKVVKSLQITRDSMRPGTYVEALIIFTTKMHVNTLISCYVG
jgi:hypothetical protein